MGVYLILGQRYKIIVNWWWCCDEGGSILEKLGVARRSWEWLGVSRREGGGYRKSCLWV